MGTVVARIVHPHEVNKWLIGIERVRGIQILRFVMLMERAEQWAIDDIRTDVQGKAIAVNDERGTAEERLHGVMRLEQVLNSPAFGERLNEHAQQRKQMREAGQTDEGLDDFDARLIEVMSMLRTGRFVVCLHHLSTLSPPFVNEWLLIVDRNASAGNVLAHVLRERLTMLKRANLIRAVFSKKALDEVLLTLGKIQS